MGRKRPQPSSCKQPLAKRDPSGVEPGGTAAIGDQRGQRRATQSIAQHPTGKHDRQPAGQPSAEVLEWFGLFHPWDFITAVATEGKPDWYSTSQYPLSPETLYQRWQDQAELVGVRFSTKKGGTTQYCAIDIDRHSAYHPCQDPEAFQRVLSALEDLGLCRYILIRSSYSGGIHVYYPLPSPMDCYRLGHCLTNHLRQQGFSVVSGQLEVFPNARHPKSVFQALRLPLQIGSYVLREDFQILNSKLF